MPRPLILPVFRPFKPCIATDRYTNATTWARPSGRPSPAAFSRARFVPSASCGANECGCLTPGCLQYNNGIPEASRFAEYYDVFKNTIDGLTTEEGVQKLEKVRALSQFAESGKFFTRFVVGRSVNLTLDSFILKSSGVQSPIWRWRGLRSTLRPALLSWVRPNRIRCSTTSRRWMSFRS